jgi:RNA polymerase sigma-70 factor (ECF subfamily)
MTVQREAQPPAPDERSQLAFEFERHRGYLRGVAYRMLGSMAEAEDALQECWLRLDRRRPDQTTDLRPWLTTVTGRICLDMLRARHARREETVGTWLPEPVVAAYDSPEEEAVRADSVGLAMLVVLETLNPAERLAFVLHDVFAVPFDEIAAILGRSPEAARQLASRARRRVRSAPPETANAAPVDRHVVEAFLAASRNGELAALLELLDPQVVLRLDVGARPRLAHGPVTGAQEVAEFLRTGAPIFAALCRPISVNGGPGFIVGAPGKAVGVVGLAVVDRRILEIDIVADPDKLRRIRIEGA